MTIVVNPNTVHELWLTVGDAALSADALNLADFSRDFWNTAYTYLPEGGIRMQGQSSMRGITFERRAINRASTTGESAARMVISIPLAIAGGGTKRSPAAGSALIANEQAIFTKWRQAARGSGSQSIGQTVYLAMRFIDSAWVFWTLYGANGMDALTWQPILPAYVAETPMRLGMLTLCCLPFAHGDPVSYPASPPLTEATPAVYRAGLRGDAPASTTLYLTDASRSGTIAQRWSIVSRSIDGMVQDGFQPLYLPTPAPGLSTTGDSTALGGTYVGCTMTPDWQDVAYFKPGAGAYERGQMRLSAIVRDHAPPIGDITESDGLTLGLQTSVIAGGGTISAGTLDLVLTPRDAAGHRGPQARATVDIQGAFESVDTLFSDTLANASQWSIFGAPGSTPASISGGTATLGAFGIGRQTPIEQPTKRLFVQATMTFGALPGSPSPPGDVMRLGNLLISCPQINSYAAFMYIGTGPTPAVVGPAAGFAPGTQTVGILWDGSGGVGEFTFFINGVKVAHAFDTDNSYPRSWEMLANDRDGDGWFGGPVSMTSPIMLSGLSEGALPANLGASVHGEYAAAENAADYLLGFQYTPKGGEAQPWQQIDLGGATAFTLTTLTGYSGQVEQNPPDGPTVFPTELRICYGSGNERNQYFASPSAVACEVSNGQWEDRALELAFALPPVETPQGSSAPPWTVVLQARNLGATPVNVDIAGLRVTPLDGDSATVTPLAPLTSKAGLQLDTRNDGRTSALLYRLETADVSGGVITDDERAAGVSGDGATKPGGYGIWQGTTNRCFPSRPAGGGWTPRYGTENFTPVGGTPFPSNLAMAVSTPGSHPNEGINAPAFSYAGGVAEAMSVWVGYPAGQHFTLSIASSALGVVAVKDCIGAGNMARYSTGFSASALPAGAYYLIVAAGALGATVAATFTVDAGQYEDGIWATPFAPVSRAAARVQQDASVLSSVAGTFAARIIMPVPPASPAGGQAIWMWPAPGLASYMQMGYDPASGRFSIASIAGGLVSSFSTAPVFYAGGEHVTIVGGWDRNIVEFARDNSGGSAARSAIPVGLDNTFDIGSTQGTNQLNGTVLWTVTLDHNASGAEIAHLTALGDSSPSPSDIPGWTSIWDARTGTYWTNTVLGAASVKGQLRLGPRETIVAAFPEYLSGGKYVVDAQHAQWTSQFAIRPRVGFLLGVA